MKTIWKYPIKPKNEIDMPKGAVVLTAQMQGSTPCMWVLVDANAPLEKRKFSVYGTGHPMPDDPGRYVSTFQVQEGALLVFHVFEEA